MHGLKLRYICIFGDVLIQGFIFLLVIKQLVLCLIDNVQVNNAGINGVRDSEVCLYYQIRKNSQVKPLK